MIRYIKGTLEMIEEDAVILDNQGIGYRILVSPAMMDRLPVMGGEMKLYTYLNVREDAMQLFGFLTQEDLEVFKLLITVNGIGPKAALSILGVMGAYDLKYAVMADDAKAISKVPGIGPKTAGKLILELKDKISIDDTLISREIAAGGAQGILTAGSLHIDSEKKKEAVEALVALGYGQAESLKAVNALEDVETMDSGAILKAALKKLF